MTINLVWVFVGIYFLVVLAVGILAARKQDAQGYLIANRKLGFLDAATSITASKIATGVVTTYAAFVYVFGVGAMMVFLGYVLGYIMFYFFAKKLRSLSEQNHYYTLADYFREQHGRTAGLIIATGTLLMYILSILIQLVGGAKILAAITNINYAAALIILSTTIALYLLAGGFNATVKTDKIQYLAMIVLLAVVAVFMSQYYTYVPTDWDPLAMGVTDGISFLLAGILIPLSTVDLYQRVYATKDAQTMKQSIFAACGFFIIIGSILSFLVLAIKHNVPTNIDPDIVLIEGFIRLLPEGMLALGVVAIFAIVMSSADTYIYTTAAIAAHDFTSRTPEQEVKYIRAVLVTLIILGTITALIYSSVVGISFLYVAITMVVSTLVLATWIQKNTSTTTLITAATIGASAVLIHAVLVEPNPKTILAALLATTLGLLLGGVINKLRG